MKKFEQPKSQEKKIDELHQKLEKTQEEDVLASYDKCTDFAKNLLKKYPDARKYRLFHLLVGSSVDEGDCEKFDFPGEDSIEKFINSL